MSIKKVSIIAGKEFNDRIRNKWILSITIIFIILSFSIAYFGSVFQGKIGITNIQLIISSLVSLVIYLIPLIALILGFDTIIGEKERGSLELMFSMPVSRLDILLGKYLGLALALCVSIVIGFGLISFLLIKYFSLISLMNYIIFIISSVFLGLVFLSLSILISVKSSDRAQASGISITTWFFFVLIFDMLLIALLVVTKGSFGGDYFPYLFILNPIDLFRILNTYNQVDSNVVFGLTSIFPKSLVNPFFLGFCAFVWIFIPLYFSNKDLKKCSK